MKKTIPLSYPLIFLFVFFLPNQSALAYSLRQFSSKNGLSNSAILSMCQDKNGFLWFGSCDGLNMFDGVSFQVYKPTNSLNHLSGNLIETMLDSEDGILWIQTNYGLDRFDSRRRTVRTFKNFKGKNRLFQSPANDVYVVKEDNFLHYYDASDDTFSSIYLGDIIFQDILEIVIDRNNILWVFSANGTHQSFSLSRDNNGVFVTQRDFFSHDAKLLYCFYEEDRFYFVDETYSLYEYDVNTKNKHYIHNIRPAIQEHGEISSVIKFRDDYLIGFKSSGMVILHDTQDSKERFSIQETDIKSGVFCLMKDKYQDIVWVGTDGQGVYMYFVEPYSIKSTLFEDLKTPLNNPIRALFIDKERTLWVGTKGNGIMKVYDYDVATASGSRAEHLLTNNSRLKDNSVYTVQPSKRNILWVGTENGINYYSFRDRVLKTLDAEVNGSSLKYVHSICELNDSTLWVATVGEGFAKITLKGEAGNPVVAGCKQFRFNNEKHSSNYFFTSYKENDSIVWFGNRGYGAYKMNVLTEEYKVFTFDENDTNQTLNDIFCITKNDAGHWFGTSYGLIRLRDGEKLLFNELNGFPNNTIHGILQENDNLLWLSTNQGLVMFNTYWNTFQNYTQLNSLDVTEFSDGAYFRDSLSGALLFGGINGYVTITKNDFRPHEYLPPIYFNRLFIYGREQNFSDYLKKTADNEILELDYTGNFFSVGFTAIDYIDGDNYTYYYKLNELSDTWIEAGSSNNASFTNVSPGEYTLMVKYRNNITGKESSLQTLSVKILPPWYRTTLAHVAYAFLILLLFFLVIAFSRKWYKMKQSAMIEKMNQRQQEEVYESKLRFFTNITHELCTPLTLITGPCEKIISYKNTDSYINKYATLIQNNAEKLNTLIQELIEFRRLETGNKSVEVQRFSVSELTRNIANSFMELAETRGVEYVLQVKEDLVWSSDSSCLSKVITNLISNAFKYTDANGRISVKLEKESEKLCITVSNTGKGIKAENISRIFDRYTVLDNFETQNKKGVSPRNGLGLAICNSMVKLLEGEIQVTSVPNEVTTFKVVLPMLNAAVSGDERDVMLPDKEVRPASEPKLMLKDLPRHDKDKKTVMVIDDDPSMLWFVTEVLMENYNVIPIRDSVEVIESLKNRQPDLIISDIMMPGVDGISLAKTIKTDKLLSHIPLILLSAKNTTEDKVVGIDSGAEAYVTKPFNVEYLETLIARLIRRKEDLKEYYNSVFSSFELNEGKIAPKEDKELFEKMLSEIDQNISNPDLSVDLLSALLGVSTRQLYRKLKNLTDKTPNDIIREYRLNTVERLLLTTNMSVDEILYKSGFVNRGNFFKIFSQKYGMTPRQYREQKKKEIDM